MVELLTIQGVQIVSKTRWRTHLFRLAEARGWNDSRLAAELGVAPSTVCRWRQGAFHTPSATLLWAAARVFQCSPSEVFWTEPVVEQEAV